MHVRSLVAKVRKRRTKREPRRTRWNGERGNAAGSPSQEENASVYFSSIFPVSPRRPDDNSQARHSSLSPSPSRVHSSGWFTPGVAAAAAAAVLYSYPGCREYSRSLYKPLVGCSTSTGIGIVPGTTVILSPIPVPLYSTAQKLGPTE